MTDYNSIEEMMNTTANMTQLINNSGQDDNVLSVDGVDWFFFNGVRASTLYVSGNSFIGMGQNAEQLVVCRRDTKLWNLYREESTLFGTYKVLKIRWEGYAQYNSTSADVAMKYEWFFIENGNMFLNLIPPKNGSYLGYSRVVAGNTIDIAVTAGQQTYVCFYALDEEGRSFERSYEIMDVQAPFERKYLLCDKDGIYYRLQHDKVFVDAIELKGYQFIRTGIVPNQDTKVKVSFKTSSFNDAALFGARESTSANKFGVFLSNSTTLHGQFNTESTNAEVDDYTALDITVELSKAGLMRDGVVIAEYTEAEFSAPVEMTIGTYNTNETLDTRYFKGLIYKVEVWQGEEQVLDLIPCVDEQIQPCFYDTLSGVCYYNDGYGTFGFVDAGLLFDEATHLEVVEFEELTADVFHTYGFTDFPRDVIFGRLINPTLLYWQDSDTELPVFKMSLSAVPPVQVVFSKNNEMIDSTILGIESVEVEADETTLFAFSFDGGETWKAYIDSAWVNLSEETSGMNKETVEAIGTDAWNEACTDKQYKIRFTLIEGGYVNRIIVHYLN